MTFEGSSLTNSTEVLECDKETAAIGRIAQILGDLEPPVRSRVIGYVRVRFEEKEIQVSTDTRTEKGGLPHQADSQFEDFASLFDACSPSTDPQRSLLAGYWLQVCQKAENFDSQSANKELKHLGHAVGHITGALGSLIDQKPALVLQIRKSGNTRQARKLYKLSEFGIRRVREMMNRSSEGE